MNRTAVVGLGVVSPHHLNPLRDTPDAEIAAVCDLDETRVRQTADTYDCAGFTSVHHCRRTTFSQRSVSITVSTHWLKNRLRSQLKSMKS